MRTNLNARLATWGLGQPSWLLVVALFVIGTVTASTAVSGEAKLAFDSSPRIELENGNAIETPSEGLWAIGTGWKDDASATVSHGDPVTRKTFGDWTVLDIQR